MNTASYWAILLVMLLHWPAPILACDQANNSMDSIVSISDRDQNKLIVLTVGQTLAVKLPGNAGTGYQWQLSKNSNAQILQLVGNMTTEPLGQGEPGLSENFVHSFQATNPGTAELEFYYVRPWEKDQPSRTFRVQVRVEPTR